MKKRIGILLLVFMMITLSACSGSSASEAPASQEAIEKDVSMLLKGIGDSIDMVQSLGDLPEAQMNGNLHYFKNAGMEGYFAGFDLGIETESDGSTIKQIYIQPIGDAKITANALVIGGSIADAKAVFGDGELSSVEQNGKIVNFMTFKDDAYNMKATVGNEGILAVAFTTIADESSASGEEESSAASEKPEQDPAADIPVESSQAEATVQVGAFDFLLGYLGSDFDDVAMALGDNYDRFEEAYEDVALYSEDGLTVRFLIDYDTNVVTAVGLDYNIFDYAYPEEQFGMVGLYLGMPAKDVRFDEENYGEYAVYVSADVNNRVCNLTATETYDGFAFEAPMVTENPADDGYELSIQNFETYSILSLTYNSTGETIELVNTKGRWDGDRFFDGFDVKILNAKASKDGQTIYFETDDPKMTNGYGAANNTILKYDLASGLEEHLCLGFLHDTVKVPGYEDCIIIKYYQPNPQGGYYQPYILIDGDANYHYMGIELESDLADQVWRAHGDEIDEMATTLPDAESIAGHYVDFSKYRIVVAEDYHGVNMDKLDSLTIQNPYYKGETLYPDYFAVFGRIFNLRWEVGIGMGESEIYPIADDLSNTYVRYETWRPGDMSLDAFLFEDANGKEYRIVIEDMSDNIDLVLIP